MTVDVQERVNETSVDGNPWHVRLVAVWRDEQMPVPIGDRSRELASEMGVSLTARPGSCVAYFAVHSPSAEAAAARGLRQWNLVVDHALLPRWEIVSFSVDQVENDLTSDQLTPSS